MLLLLRRSLATQSSSTAASGTTDLRPIIDAIVSSAIPKTPPAPPPWPAQRGRWTKLSTSLSTSSSTLSPTYSSPSLLAVDGEFTRTLYSQITSLNSPVLRGEVVMGTIKALKGRAITASSVLSMVNVMTETDTFNDDTARGLLLVNAMASPPWARRTGHGEVAYVLVRMLEDSGSGVSPAHAAHAIDALGRDGLFPQVLMVLDMVPQGLRTKPMWLAAIRAAVQCGLPQEAVALARRMRREHGDGRDGVAVDTAVAVLLFKGLLDAGHFGPAAELLRELERFRWVSVDPHWWLQLARAEVRAGASGEAARSAAPLSSFQAALDLAQRSTRKLLDVKVESTCVLLTRYYAASDPDAVRALEEAKLKMYELNLVSDSLQPSPSSAQRKRQKSKDRRDYLSSPILSFFEGGTSKQP